MTYVYKTMEIEVDLDEFSDQELIDEIERRDLTTNTTRNGLELLSRIYEKRRLNQDYQPELDQLIYSEIGKIV